MKKLFIASLFLSGRVFAQNAEDYAHQMSDGAIQLSGGLAVTAGYLTIKDESTALTQEGILTFLGTSVTCVDSGANAATECTFTGGSVAADTGWNAKGDLFVATANDTAAALSVGSNSLALVADSAQAAGVKWSTLESGSFANNTIAPARTAFAATQRLNGRNTAAAGAGEEVTATQALDWIGGTQGQVLYRGAANWTALATGTSGQFLQTQGAGANPQWASAAAFSPKTFSYQFDDFCGDTSTNSALGDLANWLQTIRNSAPGGARDDALQTAARPCIVTQSTGTNAAGGVTIQRNRSGFIFAGTETLIWSVRLEDLSVAGVEGYTLRVGYCDTTAGTGTACSDGAYFTYTDATNSGKFQINTCNNVTCGTAQDTGTTVAADTWYELKLSYESGVGMHFYINGVETSNSPINTNIPVAATHGTGPALYIDKSAGTTARVVYVDYMYFSSTISR